MIPNSIILLSLCFFVLVAIFKEASLRDSQFRWGNRDSFILASVAQATILVILTEGLSVFHLYQRKYLIGSWIFVLIITLMLFVYLRISRQGINRGLFNLKDWELPHFKNDLSTTVLFLLIGFQLMTLAMVAYVYAPNNWDSMTYHLARVMHWQQNQSVASYATHIARQIQSQPFAEYELANLQIMLKNDQYANFVQYFAFLVCFIGVTNITKKLGGRPYQQIFAGIISISIPMAILQSTSTQNDLVLSQYLICFVSLGISLIQRPQKYLWVCGVGLSLGLACLTKATAFIFALPFCIWFGILIIKNNAKNIITLLVIGVMALFLNSGFLIRNSLLFSNPLGSTIMFSTTNEAHSLGVLTSNVIRNSALNFSVKDNYYSEVMLGELQLIHTFTGQNNTDPRTSLTGWNVFSGFTQSQFFHEDFSGNPIHAILIFMTICFSFYAYKRFGIQKYVVIYEFCLIAGFLIFCFYLKFQEWGSRLLTPLFILWAPIIILFLAVKKERLLKFLIASILICSFYWTFGNSIRGINEASLSLTTDRERVYFTNVPDLYPVYAEITNKIKNSNCLAVGLNIGEDTWEYPFWVLLQNRGWHGRIEHVNTVNATSILEDRNYKPCMVISDSSIGKMNYPLYKETMIGSYYLLEQN